MIRKSPKDYIPEIVKKLNENPPINGYQVSETEVKKVLDYFLKNMSDVIQDIESEVYLIPYIWISPVRNHVVNYKKRIKEKRKEIFKKYFRG